MPQFIPGLELSRRFYDEAVRPILDRRFPALPHAAGLIGTGSDALGFDTEMSTDHSWGPSAFIFLRDEDAHLAEEIRETMSVSLPHTFYGYPVNFDPVPNEPRTSIMRLTTEGTLNHHAIPMTTRGFFWEYLGYDIDRSLDAADWLTFPSQKLRGITSGAVYYDSVGELTALRERLAYYPHDVWLYLLAAGWGRIGQEDHLMPRAGYVGDELGSAIIGSRLARDIMSLCFLMEKRYALYPKWFGTAFNQLACAKDISPALWRAQRAETWQEREAALCEAYEMVAHIHSTLGVTQKTPETVSSFHNRPFKVIQADMFAEAILAQIKDGDVKRIASRPLIGSIDQFSDSTDLRSNASWRGALRDLYE